MCDRYATEASHPLASVGREAGVATLTPGSSASPLKTGREIKGDLAAASGEIFPLFFWGGGGVGGVIVARDRWLVAGGEVDGAFLRKASKAYLLRSVITGAPARNDRPNG